MVGLNLSLAAMQVNQVGKNDHSEGLTSPCQPYDLGFDRMEKPGEASITALAQVKAGTKFWRPSTLEGRSSFFISFLYGFQTGP
jgi:hypothetical protein